MYNLSNYTYLDKLLMDKAKHLEKVASEIKNCKICKIGKSGKAVVGIGNPNAKIVFVGEAPGKTEAKVGLPFIGRSGKLLREYITKIGLDIDDVYITSPVKYLPDRGTPTKEDVEHGKIHFLKQLEIINPKIIVLLGATAAFAIFSEKIPVLKRHGEVIEKDKRMYLLTLHPAAVLRFPNKFKSIFLNDLNKLEKLV